MFDIKLEYKYMVETFLFVYGTLKRGHRNHQLLKDWTFVDKATTGDFLSLITSPYDFPYLIVSGGRYSPVKTRPVRGEIYMSTKPHPWQMLDYLEGVEHDHYQRTNITVIPDGGWPSAIFECQTYVATQSTVDILTAHKMMNENLLKGNYYGW